MTFNTIDVETANADHASICQIGIVHVRDGKSCDEWETLVNPEEWFDQWNTRIHGIANRHVINSPTLPEIAAELRNRVSRSILVSHTAFDRVSLERAMSRYELDELDVAWLDSARIVRRAWPERYAHGGWGLRNVATDLGISFKHHDALEDARATAKVVIAACEHTGLDPEDWIHQVEARIGVSRDRSQPAIRRGKSVKRTGDEDGPLHGETVVFTGELVISREEAADIAARAGCNVDSNVTMKRTTILVVGIQNRSLLKGYSKSSKHRKAEDLIQKGADIEILSEDDFHELMKDKGFDTGWALGGVDA